MKRAVCLFSLVIFFVAMSVSSVFADLLQDVKAKGKLVCGTLADSEPLGFPDPKTRQIVGFEVDICAEIARQLGVEFVQKSLTVDARIPELTLGRVDIVAAAMGYTKARAEQIDYTDSHYQNPILIMVKKSSGFTTLAQLNGKKLSATQASTPEQFIRRKIPGATILTFENSPAAFLALQQDKVVGFGITQMGAFKYLTESKGEVKFLEEPLGWEVSALGVRKGEPAFLAAVNHILEAMEASGFMQKDWDKWYGPGTAFNIKRMKKVTPIAEAIAQSQ